MFVDSVKRREAIWSWSGWSLVQIQQLRGELCPDSAGLGGDHRCAWPRWLQRITGTPSYKRAAPVFIGDILKHLVFCRSFHAHVGEGFCALCPQLHSSVCRWQRWFPFCSAVEEPKSASGTGVQQNVKTGCMQIAPSSHLPVRNYS